MAPVPAFATVEYGNPIVVYPALLVEDLPKGTERWVLACAG